MDIMIEGHMLYFGSDRTNGANPPACSKAAEKVGELWSSKIMTLKAALAEASSRQPSRMHANHVGERMPEKAQRKA
jgi:hypothetical protein